MHRIRTTLLALPAALLAACSSSDPVVRDVDWLVRHGQYAEALDLAASQAEANPDDAEAQAMHQAASVAYLLELGRRARFQGDNERALEIFERALEVDPGSKHARNWLIQTHQKQAQIWLTRAQELHTADDLVGAAAAYEMALEHEPGLSAAISGLARVLKQSNYRDGMEDALYKSGTRAHANWDLWLARHDYAGSGKYADDQGAAEKAEGRVSEVEAELSRNRVRVGEALEESEHFAAARNEFRMAMLLDPANEEAGEGYERARFEAQADELLRDGQMHILGGRFEQARETLAEGRALTRSRQARFDEVEATIEDAQVEAAYELGRFYEYDYRYEEAIEAYRRVIEMRGAYQDTIARLDTLEDYVADAEELYAKVLEATDPDEQRKLLRQIEIFWKEYKDIQRRLGELDAAAESVGADATAEDETYLEDFVWPVAPEEGAAVEDGAGAERASGGDSTEGDSTEADSAEGDSAEGESAREDG